MLSYLLRNRRSPIAIDVGTDSVKMLQLQQVGGVLSVSACARWRFPESAGDSASQRRDLAVSAVRRMLREGAFRGRRVISSLPCRRLTIKNVRLPHMPEHELRQAVLWEAQERFGFEVKGDGLSYLNAGEVRQGSEIRDEIIVLAAQGDVVDEHMTMLEQMGLRPEHIDAEPVALFRCFERFLRRRDDEQLVSVIVDIGYSATRIVVARGRTIVFVKSIDIGGRKLTEAVAGNLNLSLQEAGELRVRLMAGSESRPSGKPSDAAESLGWTIRDAVRAQVEDLAREIALCLRYCSVTFRGLRAERVTATGGEAYDAALLSLLGEQLNMECVVGQPLRGLDISGLASGDRRGTLAEWAVCAGLALRGLNVKNAASEGDDGEGRLSA